MFTAAGPLLPAPLPVPVPSKVMAPLPPVKAVKTAQATMVSGPANVLFSSSVAHMVMPSVPMILAGMTAFTAMPCCPTSAASA